MLRNPQHFYQYLAELVEHRPVCLAYSGGVDSHVLLHLLSQAPSDLFQSLRAVHINHGLHDDASAWSQHCFDTATALGIELTVLPVTVDKVSDLGLEAAAREARYHAIQKALMDDEVVLTAQHQQDQAETLLLQLLRGAGPMGLAAMQAQTRLYDMDVIRPFLSVRRDEIVAYARQHQLSWIEDPSNSDTQINRNYLRHEIWPLLQQRWPAADKTIARSAQHCEDAALIMAEVAQQDAERCQIARNQLSIGDFLKLSDVRQRNLLRFVIEQAGFVLPSAVQTQQIIDEVCLAKSDALPEVHWANIVVRRFQNILYIEPVRLNEVSPDWCCQINSTQAMPLFDSTVLKWKEQPFGLKPCFIEQGLHCRLRVGGERIRLQGHRQHKTLKHLFQEWKIPPWQRETIPLLFCNDELVAVIGYGVADAYAAEAGEKAWFPYIEQ